jgi:hypothetical protein
MLRHDGNNYIYRTINCAVQWKSVGHTFLTPLIRVLEKLTVGQLLRNSLSLMLMEIEGSLKYLQGPAIGRVKYTLHILILLDPFKYHPPIYLVHMQFFIRV